MSDPDHNVLDDFREELRDPEIARLFHQERTIHEVTEVICRLMEESNTSRSELAERLGTSRSSVTRMLSGDRNLTLRSLSDLLAALGRSLEPATRHLNERSRCFDGPQQLSWKDRLFRSGLALDLHQREPSHAARPTFVLENRRPQNLTSSSPFPRMSA